MTQRLDVGFVDPDLEGEARRLFADACKGSANLIKAWPNLREALRDSENRRAFLAAVHSGFGRAQDFVADRLPELEQIPKKSRSPDHRNRILFYRKVMDSVAWQMLHFQLYIARRLYGGHQPPSLVHSNFNAVKEEAKAMASGPEMFALISDLTTFVQVGDLLVIDMAAGRLKLIEVKTGRKNQQVGEFADFVVQSQNTYALKLFREQEGQKTFEQLTRVLRQKARMSAVVQILSKGEGVDPHLKVPITIPENPIAIQEYDHRLAEVIAGSEKSGYALDVIDGCLFLAAYRNDARSWGPGAFQHGWFYPSGGRKGFPIANLLSCMVTPLALPLFCRDLPAEHVFDLLFGRCKVILGIHLDEFAARSQARGLPLAWSTKKEAARLTSQGLRPYTVDHRALVAPLPGDGQTAFSDGLIVRMLYHGTTPDSCIDLLAHPLPAEKREAHGETTDS